MASGIMSPPISSLSTQERACLRDIIAQAHEAIAPIWPMKTFSYYNPLRGLEHLPFDHAVRKGRKILGGKGYLANEEYRRFHREGRITDRGIRRALQRVGPQGFSNVTVRVGSGEISADEVWRLHLIFGLDSLPPVLWSWTLNNDNPLTRFRQDLPAASRQRIRERTVQECASCRNDPEGTYLANLWRGILSVLEVDNPSLSDPIPSSSGTPSLPVHSTLSEWVDRLTGGELVEQINGQMIKWGASFLDEGLANWEMPLKEKGFYPTWRHLAGDDLNGPLLGIQQFAGKIQLLPQDPEDAIAWAIQELGVPEDRWKDYLARQLAYLSGWAGLIRWRSENSFYPAQEHSPIDPVQYLAVRLFYEKELVHVVCQREWNIPGTLPDMERYWEARPDSYDHVMGMGSHHSDPREQVICHESWRLFHLAQFLELNPFEIQDLSLSDAHSLLGWLDAFPAEAHGAVWLEAYEDEYREELVERLIAHRGSVKACAVRPRAQMIFCIDVRSESFRRHVEAQGPYETFGYAGFFGIPMSHVAFDSHDQMALCPILLKPKHEVTENPRSEQSDRLKRYLSGTRWQQLGHQVFHDLKYNPIGSFMLVDVLGFLFSLGLAGKTLFRSRHERVKTLLQQRMTQRVATRIMMDRLPDREQKTTDSHARFIPGFSVEEQAAFIEGGLRVIGLTRDFGRFIVACGHGSRTENNPYFAAYDCGACGGSHGDPNARVFAAMGNNPEVRRILREHGLHIPDDTWFLAGKHNTTTDRVTFYDVEDMPPSHGEDLRQVIHDLEQAGTRQALERCRRIPQAPADVSPEKAYSHVQSRSVDWANSRPEWGLSGNAAFLIGRRVLTKGLDLQGRVFLHSYDPEPDGDGGLLEKIMTAPLVVGELISLTYYFSAVDPWVYGSGSKVLHNVVSGVGVMLGSQSDLQRGLPLQSVNDGARHYHEPMRLLAVIEAPPSRISAVIQKHTLLGHLFDNQWMNLVAIDPATGEFHRYHPDATWASISAGVVEACR